MRTAGRYRLRFWNRLIEISKGFFDEAVKFLVVKLTVKFFFRVRNERIDFVLHFGGDFQQHNSPAFVEVV